ncbi:MAG TPA: APC family permease [Candidatus Baltobacterales bacterium]|nr:APC family permease [Candidatus Baltobacterales bacterium]
MASTTSTSVGGKAAAGQSLFTRQSSGLVRELGIPAATGIALASVAVVNTFINFYSGLFNFTKVDMILPLLLGAGIWLVAMFAYRYLLRAIPRAGGEYIYMSRIISPAVGTMIGIATAVGFTYTLSANANFAAAYVPFALNSLGAAFNSSALTSAATNIANTTTCVTVTCSPGLVLCAVGMLVIVGLASVFSLRRIAQVILALVVFQVVAFLVLGFLLATHSHQDFVNALGSYSGKSTAFNDVIALAQRNGVPLGVDVGASLLVVPFMVLNYNGVLYSYYVGGELKRPGSTYLWASAISLALLIVVWVGVWLLMLNTIGLNFMQAQAQVGGLPDYAKITSLQANAGGLGYGLILSGDPVTKILIGLAVPAAEIAVDLAFVAVVTRVIFALAFDRMLPIGLAKVSERNASPVNAIILAVILGIAFTIAGSVLNIANISANLALFFALVLLAGSIAAAALPYRRPELIYKPGTTDVDRIAGIPTATVWGSISTVLALFTVGVIIAKPNVFGAFSVASVGSLIVIFFSGPIIYVIARRMRLSSSSIDMRLAMRELPPE